MWLENDAGWGQQQARGVVDSNKRLPVFLPAFGKLAVSEVSEQRALRGEVIPFGLTVVFIDFGTIRPRLFQSTAQGVGVKFRFTGGK